MIFSEKQEIVMRRGDLTCQMCTQPTRIKDTLTEKNVVTVTDLVTLFEIVQSLEKRLHVQCVEELAIGINDVLTLVVSVVEILIICSEIFVIIAISYMVSIARNVDFTGIKRVIALTFGGGITTQLQKQRIFVKTVHL